MRAERFLEEIKNVGIESLIGVPDSTLKEFCDYINREGKEQIKHYVPANEGAAIGMATGVYLATGRPACVYMQNSGLGNTVNPITSLANQEVYDIPMLLMIGWRGEPGIHDEPQHKFMGKITTKLLEVLQIEYEVLDENTTDSELEVVFQNAVKAMKKNKQFAIIVKKGTFEKENQEEYQNGYTFVREDAIHQILASLNKEDVVVSTTGKISREVYEQADIVCGQHQQEFLTVGGMGHASMIAFGIAQNQREKRIYCLDGDGAVLMHMGSLAFIGKEKPQNMVHICLNNDAHESVGGMPTGAVGLDFAEIAKKCGYEKTYYVENTEELEQVLPQLQKERKLTFVEVKVALSSRSDLGRPKESAVENKKNFMSYHKMGE